MKKKCLVLNDREPIPENHLDDLDDRLDVAWHQRTGADFSLAEAIATHADSHILITTYMDLNAGYLRRMPNLEAIITTTVSTHYVDSGYCGEHGIKIFNTENYTGASVAEHAVALMMSAARQIPAIDGEVRRGNTECFDYPGAELAGKTAGIIGFGNIGGYVAKLLSGFDMQLQYYNRSPRESALARAVDLETLLDTSDIVFLTVTLNNDSHHMIDETALRRMKSSALLVNISPDDVMDKAAVERALENGEIRGAAMDLLEPKLFLDTPRAILTVRRAWFTTECFARRIGMWKGILKSYLAGDRIKTVHDLDFVPIEGSNQQGGERCDSSSR
uniref:Glycerate dehydrogenase/C-terminal binding protein n=1 Tax=Candidatus Kentrum sp. TC TaxID=2126339 RepID=A0A450YPZ2_9GAMM|nr:MAG: glycerate dehydrogenase/C-terminal binding protein [Candidatus Kentron sp. TC]VFK45079.1 MAG: glycerate dehydrogenase/C-terminal binding protein [Candidatus Kentron sp. TC]VFK58251.1 MAG: glycerate dehydrogenase/C-terminal binding protein [Candidatus Kentron sp. TC]